jgi:WD40 repeat protein
MSNYPVANFDPTGVAFGVAWSIQQKDKQLVRICLYGLADCETGPFADWRKDLNEVKVMKFSNNGEIMILATADNSIVLLDAFEGNEIHKFTSFLNESSII